MHRAATKTRFAPREVRACASTTWSSVPPNPKTASPVVPPEPTTAPAPPPAPIATRPVAPPEPTTAPAPPPAPMATRPVAPPEPTTARSAPRRNSARRPEPTATSDAAYDGFARRHRGRLRAKHGAWGTRSRWPNRSIDVFPALVRTPRNAATFEARLSHGRVDAHAAGTARCVSSLSTSAPSRGRGGGRIRPDRGFALSLRMVRRTSSGGDARSSCAAGPPSGASVRLLHTPFDARGVRTDAAMDHDRVA